MVGRHVLAALRAGVAAGSSEDAARAALAGTEWVLRRAARRRLEGALIDATLATGSSDEGYRLRAAAVIVGGEGCELADREAVTAAFERLPHAAPSRVPVATIAAGAVAAMLVVGLAAAAVGIVTAQPAVAFTRAPPPPAVGAYRDGGVPLRDPAIEQVLAHELPALLSHSAADEVGWTARVARLRAEPAFARHGEGLAVAWRGMIDTLAHWEDLDSTDGGYRTVSSELRAHIEVLSDQLAAARLGYYLDPEILAEHSRRSAGIYAYRVDEVAFVRANDQRVRVLGVRRLDHLGDQVAMLGLTTDELHDSIVVLDQIDDKVQRQVLPVLAGASYPLGYEASPRGRAAALAAGEAIRRELGLALGDDAATVERATTRLQHLITTSVRHHEAQHGYDHDLPLPRSLAPVVGDPASTFALRARYELSAYLSQIASDMFIPQLTLWNLARHAFRRSTPHEESYVAIIAIEGIARHLHLEPVGPVLHDGTIDRERLALLVPAIAAHTTTELRAAAAKLWSESFGQRLVRIVDE